METKIWETLERTHSTLGLSHESWVDLLQLTESRYEQIRRERAMLPERSIVHLANSLEISPESIYRGDIDFKALATRQSGNSTFLPDRYAEHALSKRRTSISVLDYIEVHFGWNRRNQLLKRFQVNEAIFSNPDAAISLRFLIDILGAFNQEDASKTFLGMGKQSALSNYNSSLGQAYRALKTPKNAYEGMFTNVAPAYYDRNFSYRIHELTEDHCLFEARATEELEESFSSKTPGSEALCSYRSGVASSVLGYLDLPMPKVTKVACVHRGDATCLHRIDYTLGNYIQKRFAASAIAC